MALALFVSACAQTPASVEPRGGALCTSDRDCASDEVCEDGLCVRAPTTLPPLPQRDGGAAADGGPAPDGGAAPDGGRDGGGTDGGVPDGGTPDGGAPDGGAADGGAADGGGAPDGGGADAGAPRFCAPCTSDAQCGSMKCVTLERTGERFCSPACASSLECPTASTCLGLIVNQGTFCVPTAGTCLEARCDVRPCPPDIPNCDPLSGRCFRSENLAPCQPCQYSYQCGGYYDRCVVVEGAKRCGLDCDSSRGGQCLSGYECREVATVTGSTSRQCAPLTRDCGDCRADNPCPPGDTCDIPTGSCVRSASVQSACTPCSENRDCGPATQTCYQGGCAPYCDTYTPCPSSGYRCAQIDDGGDTVRRCIPNTTQNCELLLFCAPCAHDDDCNGGHCVNVPGSGSKRCAPHCLATGILFCPTESSCVSGPDNASICLPDACP